MGPIDTLGELEEPWAPSVELSMPRASAGANCQYRWSTGSIGACACAVATSTGPLGGPLG